MIDVQRERSAETKAISRYVLHRFQHSEIAMNNTQLVHLKMFSQASSLLLSFRVSTPLVLDGRLQESLLLDGLEHCKYTSIVLFIARGKR